MSIFEAAGIIAGGVVVLGGTSFSGAYGATFTTIENHFKDSLLDNEGESSEDWKALQKKLNNAGDIEKYMDASLQAAKKENKEDGNDYETGIKSWCNKNRGEKINPKITFLPWSNQLLLEAVNNFCVWTIKEKLGDQKIDLSKENDSSATLKTKFQSLSSHNDSSHGELDNDLKLIKQKSGNEEEGWKRLRNWCAKAYEKGYSKKRENLWKLVQHYCKKP